MLFQSIYFFEIIFYKLFIID